MAEKELEAEDIERKVHDLANAMKHVKTSQAERDDVIVEMKHAKISRLELLAEDLTPVFDDIPKENDSFEFALVNGETPRLWIDMTSFVRMGKDGRVYEFVKDTRMGRTILASSKNREKFGEHVTNYVAERILERERLLEGEWVSARKVEDDNEETEVSQSLQSADPKQGIAEDGSKSKSGLSLLATLVWFVFGLAIGLSILAFAMVFDQFEPLRAWIAGISG